MKKFVSEVSPSKEELVGFMGESGKYYLALEKFCLDLNPNIDVRLHNTGNSGWIIKYYLKQKYVAQFNIVENSFELMCRFNEKAVAEVFAIENQFAGNGKTAWEQRYPCGTGFWIHLWVNNEKDYADALLAARILITFSLRKEKKA